MLYIEHARNFGEHNAVMTGLRHARGGYVITWTTICRIRPTKSPGCTTMPALRLGRGLHALCGEAARAWRNFGSRFANWVADRLLDKPRGLYLSSFRCMAAPWCAASRAIAARILTSMA